MIYHDNGIIYNICTKCFGDIINIDNNILFNEIPELRDILFEDLKKKKFDDTAILKFLWLLRFGHIKLRGCPLCKIFYNFPYDWFKK